jgi:hypothetical protein
LDIETIHRVAIGRRDGPTFIDYFQCPVPTRAIAVTFTSWNHPGAVTPDGPGYALTFLLEAGFSVVAFKATRNNWFQDLMHDDLDGVDRFILSRGYTERVAYGSSMGGFAALRFATKLRIDRVLALSPQFEIDKPWDTRWAFEARETVFRLRADDLKTLTATASQGARCRYFVAFDPYQALDAGHALRYGSVLPAEDLRLLRIPFSGHPVDRFLADIKALKPFALGILRDGQAQGIAASRNARHGSPSYLFQLSLHARSRNKPRLALILVDAALRLDPASVDLHLLRSGLLHEVGDIPGALAEARLALAGAPDAHHLLYQLAYMARLSGEREAALAAIEKAVSIQPGIGEYHSLRSVILHSGGRLREAIAAIEMAMRVTPEATHFSGWLNQLRLEEQLPGAMPVRSPGSESGSE